MHATIINRKQQPENRKTSAEIGRASTREFISLADCTDFMEKCASRVSLFYFFTHNVTHPNLACANEKELEKITQSAAQAYLDRWGNETFFRELKQNFKIEEARPRTFRALNNLFMLSILAHYFVKDFRSRPSRELSKITKLIKDNFSQINSKTFSFLQNLRALFCEKSLKFISVRPKKPPKIAPKQLIFPFYPA